MIHFKLEVLVLVTTMGHNRRNLNNQKVWEFEVYN